MSEKLVTGHTMRAFDEEMSTLNKLVLEAAAKARDQLAQALYSLEEEDAERARKVVLRDKEIDAMELEADDAVFHIIARRQPVAKDLRDLLAVSKIMVDVERIGDEARRLARLTLAFYDGDYSPPNYRLLSDIPKLAQFVDGMVDKAIGAFERDDARLALEVLHLDAELDEEMKDALRRLSTYLLEDARSVGHVVKITLGLRGVERIGSHAAYIARHVIFLVKGRDVRHEKLEDVERVLQVKGAD
jgi:phosphate transport system protein